jgi:hypothetical protein
MLQRLSEVFDVDSGFLEDVVEEAGADDASGMDWENDGATI